MTIAQHLLASLAPTAAPVNKIVLALVGTPFIAVYDNGVKESDPATIVVSETIVGRLQASSDYAFLFGDMLASQSNLVSPYDITGAQPVYNSARAINPLPSPFNGSLNVTCVSPDGRYVVITTGSSPYIEVFDTANGMATVTGAGQEFSALKAAVRTLAPAGMDWGTNGVLALAYTTSPFLRLHDMAGAAGAALTNPSQASITGALRDAAFSGDGKYLFAVGTFPSVGADAQFAWWDTTSWTLQTAPAATVNGVSFAQFGLSVNYDGTFVAAGTQKSGEWLVTWSRSGSTLTKNAAPSSPPAANTTQAITEISNDGKTLYFANRSASGQSIYEYSIPGLVLATAWATQPVNVTGMVRRK